MINVNSLYIYKIDILDCLVLGFQQGHQFLAIVAFLNASSVR